MWIIRYDNKEEILFDIWLVSKFEKQLRENKIEYRTECIRTTV